jgi:hypothetical protein
VSLLHTASYVGAKMNVAELAGAQEGGEGGLSRSGCSERQGREDGGNDVWLWSHQLGAELDVSLISHHEYLIEPRFEFLQNTHMWLERCLGPRLDAHPAHATVGTAPKRVSVERRVASVV